MTAPALRNPEQASYSPEQRAAALLALSTNGGNLARTSAEIGIPYSTLRGWRDGSNAGAIDARRLSGTGLDAMAEEIQRICWKIVQSIGSKTIRKAGLAERARSLGILVDKLLTLRGQASKVTEIRQTIGPDYDYARLTVPEMDELARLLSKAKPEAGPSVVVNVQAGGTVSLTAPLDVPQSPENVGREANSEQAE